jgi:hypothetical protein
MKLICPYCNQKNDIGVDSRYFVFECSQCCRHWRGIQANVALSSRLNIINPFSKPDYEPWVTPCPYCEKHQRLGKDPEYTGYTSPSVCRACCHKLPINDVPEDYTEEI